VLSPRQFFKAYSQYCADFMGAQARLDGLRARDGAKSVFEAALQDAERRSGQKAASLLIKPVQRLCKYPLLFREIIKALPVDDDSQPALERAASAVSGAAQAVNERVREVEGRTTLAQLAEGLAAPNLITPSRFVVLSVQTLGIREEVGGPTSRRTDTPQDLTLHLCNDVLLLVASRREWVGSGTKVHLLAISSLSRVSLETAGVGADGVRTLRLKLTPPPLPDSASCLNPDVTDDGPELEALPLSGFASMRVGTSLNASYMLEMSAADADEATATFRELRARDAAHGEELERVRALRSAAAGPAGQPALPTTKEAGAGAAAPASSDDRSLNFLRRLARFGREEDGRASGRTSKPDTSAPSSAPPPPTLRRGVSKEQVQDVMGKVDSLGKLVRSLSQEGTALADALKQHGAHARVGRGRQAGAPNSAAGGQDDLASAQRAQQAKFERAQAVLRAQKQAALREQLKSRAAKSKFSYAAREAARDEDEWAED
jgi:hypothetical protein